MSSNATAPRGRGEDGGGDRVGDLLGLVEQLEHALGRRNGRLEHVHDARGLDDRERELARVLDERDDVAEADRPVGDPQAADHADRDVVEVRDELHRGLDQAGQEHRRRGGLVEALVLGLELRDRLALAPERLDDRVARVHLLDVPVERAGRGPLGDELALRPPDDEDHQDERCRHGEQRDECEDRADREHQDQTSRRSSAAT